MTLEEVVNDGSAFVIGVGEGIARIVEPVDVGQLNLEVAIVTHRVEEGDNADVADAEVHTPRVIVDEPRGHWLDEEVVEVDDDRLDSLGRRTWESRTERRPDSR